MAKVHFIFLSINPPCFFYFTTKVKKRAEIPLYIIFSALGSTISRVTGPSITSFSSFGKAIKLSPFFDRILIDFPFPQ
jgi:hypothetical protein